jgi:hypothetical protein
VTSAVETLDDGQRTKDHGLVPVVPVKRESRATQYHDNVHDRAVYRYRAAVLSTDRTRVDDQAFHAQSVSSAGGWCVASLLLPAAGGQRACGLEPAALAAARSRGVSGRPVCDPELGRATF